MRTIHSNTSGMSLIQACIMLAAGSLVMVSVLPGGDAGNASGKADVTMARMQRIESAMQEKMAILLRRPCPSDITLPVTDPKFGEEAANPGRCTGGNPSSNFATVSPGGGALNAGSTVLSGLSSTNGIKAGWKIYKNGLRKGTVTAVIDGQSVRIDPPAPTTSSGPYNFTSNVVVGGVPVKTLGLPNEYAFDGYGNRIKYSLDADAAHPEYCRNKQSYNARGSLNILSTSPVDFSSTPPAAISPAPAPIDNVMWALSSPGKDRYWAISDQGGAPIDSGVSNNDTYNNASRDANGNAYFTGALVKHTPTSGFDDLVWTLDSSKNKCCRGKMCSYGSAIAAVNTSGGLETTALNVMTGDVNGDGKDDLIIGMTYANKIAIVLGNTKGWPVSTNPVVSARNYLDLSNPADLDGTMDSKGYIINGPSGAYGFARVMAVGDIDHDNYDDIVIGSLPDVFVVKGQPNPVDVTLTATGIAGANGVILNTGVTGGGATNTSPGAIALGDINGDGYKDIILSPTDLGNDAYVVYGVANNWSRPVIKLTTSLNSSTSSHDGGSVTVNATPEGDGASIIIQDKDGAGIKLDPIGGAEADIPRQDGGTSAIENYLGLSSSVGFRIVNASNPRIGFAQGIHTLDSGNVNGDVNGNKEIDDLVIGAPYNGYTVPINNPTRINVLSAVGGGAYVLYGRKNWLSDMSNRFTGCSDNASICTLDLPAQLNNTAKSAILNPMMDSNSVGYHWHFGEYVAVAHLDGDTLKDILVSHTQEILGYFGKTGAAPQQAFHVNTWANLNAGANGAAHFPQVMKVADLNGDGMNDVMLSTPYVLNSTGADWGRTFVAFQPQTGFAPTLRAATPAPSYYQMFVAPWPGFPSMNPWFNNRAVSIDTKKSFSVESGGSSGASPFGIAAGDFNGDGKPDLVVVDPSVVAVDPATNTYLGAPNAANHVGMVYVINGQNNVDRSKTMTTNALTGIVPLWQIAATGTGNPSGGADTIPNDHTGSNHCVAQTDSSLNCDSGDSISINPFTSGGGGLSINP